ncbi:hypothetical protein F2Q70_00008204 [Brassica cretica]|uniref:Uncharacterized protein n=1 Tax=Brassica cretica TaxID=69181 RepID=A0A8S9M706_BRACR|nr:hypothetical protein F2Q70_00008204 [Brassica cretica]
MFDKLRDRMEKEAYRIVEETLNTFTKEDGVFITQVDLFGWAKCLDEDGKHQNAYEINEWIKKKKMTLSPSELATFVADGVKAA